VEDIDNRLTRVGAERIWPIVARSRSLLAARSMLKLNPNNEHSRPNMGSTSFGADLTAVGYAVPQHTKIDRAGCGRVRMMVAPG
jgi:hypothetical protein